MFTLGPKIGAGGNKYCHSIIEIPGRVALVHRDTFEHAPMTYQPTTPRPSTPVELKRQYDALVNERDTLKQLRGRGINALRARLNLIRFDKDTQVWALTAPRYEFNDKENLWEQENRYTLGHATSLSKIADQLRRARVVVGDPQFLFRGDSEVVLADPLGIDMDDVSPEDNSTALHVDSFVEAIRKKYTKRALKAA